MGLNAQGLKLILEEDKHKKINGRVLCLGQNTVHVKPNLLQELADEYKKDLPAKWFENKDHVDKETKTAKRVAYPCIKQSSLFKIFFPDIKEFAVLDCSNYEGASVIADLNMPFSKELSKQENMWDFIFDGSVLDNIFNPTEALITIHRFLKPFGRVVSVNSFNFLPGAMLSISCEWFYSFFAQNNYVSNKVYLNALRVSPEVNAYNNIFDWFIYSPVFTPKKNFDAGKAANETYKKYSSMNVLVAAEKGSDNNEISFPQNLQYCFDENQIWHKEKLITKSRDLPNLYEPRSADIEVFDSDHYKYIGRF